MKNKNENEKLKLEYIKAIYSFENNLSSIYRQKNKIKRKGHIINLKDYDDLKKKLDYNNKKNKIKNIGNIQLKYFEKIYTI